MFQMIFIAILATWAYYQTPWGEEDLAQTKVETIAKNEVREAAVKACYKKGAAYAKEAGVFVNYMAHCERVPTAYDSFKPFCVDLKKRDQIRKEKARTNPALLEALEVEWKKADKKYPKCDA